MDLMGRRRKPPKFISSTAAPKLSAPLNSLFTNINWNRIDLLPMLRERTRPSKDLQMQQSYMDNIGGVQKAAAAKQKQIVLIRITVAYIVAHEITLKNDSAKFLNGQCE
jgi:hypothetical protein